MKITYPLLTALCLSASFIPARAQFYLDGLSNYNDGGIVSYYEDSALVTASGSYTAVNAALTLHGGQVLQVDGPYTASGGSIDSLVGDGSATWPPVDATKTISGTVAPTFDNVVFANGTTQAVNITNTNGTNVATSAYFGNGLTTTVRSNHSTGALRFQDGATYTNSALGDAQYVNGYVSKIGDDAFTFPVGSQAGDDLRTLQITAPGTATDHLSVAYWSGDAGSGIDPTPTGTQSLATLNPAGTPGVDQLFSVSPICFWDWIPVSGTSSVTITVSIPDFSGNGGYVSATTMRLVGWNTVTQQWDNLSGSTGASGLTEGSTISGTVSDMSIYSAIAIGNVIETPLPLTITTFTGSMDKSCTAQLEWTTVSEKAVDKFVIQYSVDGRAFINAGEVLCKNTGANTYRFAMPNVPQGNAYFRLMVIDQDGTVAYHNQIIQLHSTCEGTAAIAVWPNPTKNGVIINGLKDNSTILVLDATGRQLSKIVTNKGIEQISLNGYADGTYILRITDGNGEVINKKIVKQQ